VLYIASMLRLLILGVALLAFFHTVPARAERELHEPAFREQPSESRSVKPEQQYRLGEERFYGWQTLIADTLGITLMVAGSDDAKLFGTGAATYLLGSPLVHTAHGRVGTSLGSLGLHLLGEGAAFFAFLSGCGDVYDHETGREETSCRDGVGRAASVLILTTLVEVGALGWERERIPISKPAPTPRVSFGIAPQKDGVSVLFAGTL
jgi:hypothetical protein